jgi:hypothetical protein
VDRDSEGCIPFSLIAFCASGVLAMIATWCAVELYPASSDDAAQAFLGFSFVMFLDAFFIYRLIVPEFRKGHRIVATKWLVGSILLGLLVAAVVGGGIFCLTRWGPDDPWFVGILVFLALGFIGSLVRSWKRWRSRRALL